MNEDKKAASRKTKQKEEIFRVIQDAKGPLSVKEIYDLSKITVKNIGIATVYRTVHNLLESEKIHEIKLPGESSRFETSHLDHHHHFHCIRCDRVFDVEVCPFPIENLPKGFRVDSHEIILYGVCSECNLTGK
ncbi:ferric uptake regulator family protein [Leptospira inadai serovar Lyme str. 10]|uniref:Ferric uptake regulator family protein n=2 Tax=Leptospira inadai serovar Lyme TaxID=293084 RepID=V6HHQ7_9LEPT|nr:transcriptional repressor [Leptospira inadai]EQA36020.1 ferric uptake regulator family protein [Leptospira inadai serovar Lyme str. 10]PNV77063.1 transcriptional repressor [Leptospira inadai serovar Lyme]